MVLQYQHFVLTLQRSYMLIPPKKNSLAHYSQKVKQKYPSFKILIGADMNATIGEESFGSWSFLGPNNDKYKTNDNGTRLLSLSNENKLFIMNSLFTSKAIHRHYILVKIIKVFYSGTSACIKGSKIFFKTFTGCRQGGLESPVLFNIYLDFVLRCVEHEVRNKFPNTGLKYSYRIPGHCSTRGQRSVHGLSGTQRLRMILYADDIALLCSNIDELAEILNIYDKIFTRFGLKIAASKTETMAFNVPEEIKAKPSLISIGGVALKNVRIFKYLGHVITNNDDDPSHYLSFRISSAFQKWNELKHVLTDRGIFMSTRIKLLEACVRSRLLYSSQSWDLAASELRKLESIWHSFLRKMVTNGFKRKHVPPEYLKARKKAKKSKSTIPDPEGLDIFLRMRNYGKSQKKEI